MAPWRTFATAGRYRLCPWTRPRYSGDFRPTNPWLTGAGTYGLKRRNYHVPYLSVKDKTFALHVLEFGKLQTAD